MTAANSDPRAVSVYRVPARTLRPGDLVNTAGRDDQDWQQVRAVYTQDTAPGATAEIQDLVSTIGDRYVLVEMSDVTPVDSGIYFADGTAFIAADEDPADDARVTDTVSEADAGRNYLYTVHELVTIRAALS